VIVHDTVYLEKHLPLKSANLVIAPLAISQKEIKDLYQENIDKHEVEKKVKRKISNTFQYGVEAGIGFKNPTGQHLCRK
jgi:hypothetical protein